MNKTYEECADIGAMAISIFAKKLEAKGLRLISLEGTEADLKHGIDYELSNGEATLNQGAHRHIMARYAGNAMLRYKRKSGANTDFQRLITKPDNFLYSFSFGRLADSMPITTTTVRSIRKWLKDREDIEEHIVWPFGRQDNAFLQIPFAELENVRVI